MGQKLAGVSKDFPGFGMVEIIARNISAKAAAETHIRVTTLMQSSRCG